MFTNVCNVNPFKIFGTLSLYPGRLVIAPFSSLFPPNPKICKFEMPSIMEEFRISDLNLLHPVHPE